MEKRKKIQKSIALILLFCLVATNIIYATTSTAYATSASGTKALALDERLRNSEEGTGENEKEGLSVNMVAKTGDTEVNDGDTVYEGQVIRYTYDITNNSDKDIENVKLSANHEGANIFEDVTEQQMNTARPDEMLDFTYEMEVEKSNTEYNIEKIQAGETQQITYQIRVKEDIEEVNTISTIEGNDFETVEIQSSNKVEEAELKLGLTNNEAKEFPMVNATVFTNVLEIGNISDQTLNDIIIDFTIPEEFEYSEQLNLNDENVVSIVQKEENNVKLKINTIEANSNVQVYLTLKMTEQNPQRDAASLTYSATINQNTYYSNGLDVQIARELKSQIETNQESNIDNNEIVKSGDELTYVITMKNIGEDTDSFAIYDKVPIAAVVKNAYYEINNEKNNVENIEDNTVNVDIKLENEQEARLYIETEIDETKTSIEEITNYATIMGHYLDREIKTNEITHKLQANINEDNPGEDNPGEENPGEENPGEDNPKEEKTGISGIIIIGIIIALIAIITTGIVIYNKKKKGDKI